MVACAAVSASAFHLRCVGYKHKGGGMRQPWFCRLWAKACAAKKHYRRLDFWILFIKEKYRALPRRRAGTYSPIGYGLSVVGFIRRLYTSTKMLIGYGLKKKEHRPCAIPLLRGVKGCVLFNMPLIEFHAKAQSSSPCYYRPRPLLVSSPTTPTVPKDYGLSSIDYGLSLQM